MLKIDEKEVTKNLQFNIKVGKISGKKVMFPVHKTEQGITTTSFKLGFKDIFKVLRHRKVYLQLVPNKEKLPGVVIDVSPAEFEVALKENELFLEKENQEKEEE